MAMPMMMIVKHSSIVVKAEKVGRICEIIYRHVAHMYVSNGNEMVVEQPVEQIVGL